MYLDRCNLSCICRVCVFWKVSPIVVSGGLSATSQNMLARHVANIVTVCSFFKPQVCVVFLLKVGLWVLQSVPPRLVAPYLILDLV